MEEDLSRKVKGIWVPIEIWEAKDLNWNEKILFLEIDSYTTKDKDCYMSNKYISELLHVNETTANKILSSLMKKGYVIKTKFDGRKRYVRSALSITTRQGCDKSQGRVVICHNILNNINNIDNNITTTSTTRACEENNNSDENTAYHEELKKNKSVEEMTCMNLHIDPPKYEDKLEEFKRECFSKGTFHQNSQDYRRHFYDWLRINLESENKKEKINGNGNGKIRSEIENRNEKMREAYYRDAERLGIKADPCPF